MSTLIMSTVTHAVCMCPCVWCSCMCLSMYGMCVGSWIICWSCLEQGVARLGTANTCSLPATSRSVDTHTYAGACHAHPCDWDTGSVLTIVTNISLHIYIMATPLTHATPPFLYWSGNQLSCGLGVANCSP